MSDIVTPNTLQSQTDRLGEAGKLGDRLSRIAHHLKWVVAGLCVVGVAPLAGCGRQASANVGIVCEGQVPVVVAPGDTLSELVVEKTSGADVLSQSKLNAVLHYLVHQPWYRPSGSVDGTADTTTLFSVPSSYLHGNTGVQDAAELGVTAGESIKLPTKCTPTNPNP